MIEPLKKSDWSAGDMSNFPILFIKMLHCDHPDAIDNMHFPTFPLSFSFSLPPSGQQAFLLENVPCSNTSCQSVGRMFHIHWDQSDLGAIQNAIMATFFDIYEDVSSCVLR